MNWRMVVAILVILDVMFGLAVYTSGTENLDQTKYLYGWDAVREMCFVIFPLMMGGAVILTISLIFLLHWATKK